VHFVMIEGVGNLATADPLDPRLCKYEIKPGPGLVLFSFKTHRVVLMVMVSWRCRRGEGARWRR